MTCPKCGQIAERDFVKCPYCHSLSADIDLTVSTQGLPIGVPIARITRPIQFTSAPDNMLAMQEMIAASCQIFADEVDDLGQAVVFCDKIRGLSKNILYTQGYVAMRKGRLVAVLQYRNLTTLALLIVALIPIFVKPDTLGWVFYSSYLSLIAGLTVYKSMSFRKVVLALFGAFGIKSRSAENKKQDAERKINKSSEA